MFKKCVYYHFSVIDVLKIGEQQREQRRKKWEALFEKYENRGKINTTSCYVSEINYKLFAKSLVKTKYKTKRTKKSNKVIDSGSRTSHKITHKVKNCSESTASSTLEFVNIDASRFIDEDSNDRFDPCSTRNENCWEGIENVSICETESVDSGVDLNDRAEEISEIISPSNMFIDGDVNEIIDGDNHAEIIEISNLNAQNNCTKIDPVVNDNFHKLINLIEKTLNSNLKMTLKNRSVSKLLEREDYSYWHKLTKQEMARLEKYISKNDLKQYMRYCYSGNITESINANLIQDMIVCKMNSNLKKLFLKREFSKNDKNQYLKYHKKLIIEWQRLEEVVPLDYLVLYGTNILYSMEKQRER